MTVSKLARTALLAAFTLLPAATLDAHDRRHHRKHYRHANRYYRHYRYAPRPYGFVTYGLAPYYYPAPVYRPRVVVVAPPAYPAYHLPPPVYAAPPAISIGVFIGR